MDLRTRLILFVSGTLLAVLAGAGVRAVELAVHPDGPAGIAVESPHLAAASEGETADTPHLAAAGADTPHLPAAGQPTEVEITDHPKTPEELLARMAKAREAIRTVDVTYRETSRTNWDALNLDIWRGSGLTVPPTGWDVGTSEHRLCLDGCRWRREDRCPARDGPFGPTPARLCVDACDGATRRHLELPDDELAEMRSVGKPGIWDRILSRPPKDKRLSSLGYICAPPEAGRLESERSGPLSDFHRGLRIQRFFGTLAHVSLAQPGTSPGDACYRLVVEVCDYRYSYYVSPEYGWAPVRTVPQIVDAGRAYPVDPASSPIPALPEWEIHYRQDRSGLWYPCDWTSRSYTGHGPGRQLVAETICVVESVTLNEPLADGLFTVGFPDGLRVSDHRRGGVTVTWDSSLSSQELEVLFAAAAGARLAAQLEAAEERTGTHALKPGKRAPAPGERAPAIDLTALDGSPVALADLRGRWVLLAFWDSGETGCLASLPRLKELHDRFASAGRLRIIGLSVGPDPELLKAAVEEHELPWPQVSLEGDDGRTVREAYAVKKVPSFFLIAPDGYVEVVSPHVGTAVNAVQQAMAEPDNESTP
jgi:peroxiredoxin